MVHGGPASIVNTLAKYAECDVKGTLARFDTNGNSLIQYSWRAREHAGGDRQRAQR